MLLVSSYCTQQDMKINLKQMPVLAYQDKASMTPSTYNIRTQQKQLH